jgi:AcrR family transcriptional regulator
MIRGPGIRAGLTRAKVLEAALRLVDRDGLSALTMRRLGAELGVEAMTIYSHVPDKAALLDGLVERVLQLSEDDLPNSDGWSELISTYANAFRTTLLRHPHVLPAVISRAAATPATLDIVERLLQRLTAAGFSLNVAVDLINCVSVFVLGHVSSEVTPKDAGPGSAQALAELDETRFPLVIRAATTGAGTDDQDRFHAGIAALVTGFSAVIRSSPQDDVRVDGD